ncbi:precorrin-2 C(20)-methyltransferase [Candidatus Marsarchaeota G1 archaeon BE_D]|jgi:precorrin-2/cobalt-factor-2 C20-methyltransferase|uniref:Precorrin-2 C(20)-methyltransferase n=1 Tax=Candidatus Marsarchaeota G1 archaeon BE_D TaxID=1978156 RepID=A0A2R6AH51_9ARCH|nr:MAG: precorrin-2 C(20)-methyltransferase [Candidatus Marsarchaeota G1 archaeon BE_D]
MTGKLYCIGVGPGDPELITVKALKALKQSRVIFIPSPGPTSKKLALQIVENALKERGGIGSKLVVELHFPMTRDQEALKRAWRENAQKIAQSVLKGETCCYVVLGDPLLYSTFGHIHTILREYGVEAEFIPGVSSITACPAKVGLILAEERDTIVITPAENLDVIKKCASIAKTMILIKGSVNLDSVIDTIKQAGVSENTRVLYVRRCTIEGEKYVQTTISNWEKGVIEEDYFSMLVVGGALD